MVDRGSVGQLNGPGYLAEAVSHDRQIGCGDRDVSAAAHRCAQIGLRQACGISDAVPGNRHDSSRGLQVCSTSTLPSGRTPAMTSRRDSDLGGDRRRSRGVVSGQRDGSQANGLQTAIAPAEPSLTVPVMVMIPAATPLTRTQMTVEPSLSASVVAVAGEMRSSCSRAARYGAGFVQNDGVHGSGALRDLGVLIRMPGWGPQPVPVNGLSVWFVAGIILRLLRLRRKF